MSFLLFPIILILLLLFVVLIVAISFLSALFKGLNPFQLFRLKKGFNYQQFQPSSSYTQTNSNAKKRKSKVFFDKSLVEDADFEEIK